VHCNSILDGFDFVKLAGLGIDGIEPIPATDERCAGRAWMRGRCGSLLHFEDRPISSFGNDGVGVTAGGMDHEAIAMPDFWANSSLNGLTQDLSAPLSRQGTECVGVAADEIGREMSAYDRGETNVCRIHLPELMEKAATSVITSPERPTTTKSSRGFWLSS
jgi:hypothetical protein